MDINQLSKINTLSSELKKHGMAENSTVALQQAEEIMQTEGTQAGKETMTIQEPQTNQLAERQVQIEIEKVQKVIAEELDTFRNAINQVIIEVNNVRDDVSKLRTTLTQPKAKETQVTLAEEKKIEVKPAEPHPRQGNLTSKDVDIQKMFYFGNK